MKKIIMGIVILLSSPASFSYETEMIDASNCFSQSVDQDRYCQIVQIPVDPDIYSWDWFLAKYDKYGAEIGLVQEAYKGLKDGKLDRNDINTLVNAVGAYYGLAGLGNILFGGGGGPSTEEVLLQAIEQLTYVIEASEDRIVAAIYDVKVDEDQASIKTMYYDAKDWAYDTNIHDKITDAKVTELIRIKNVASLLFSNRYSSYNELTHIDRLHGFIQVAATMIQLQAEITRISKYSANQEYFKVYTDLTDSFKFNNIITNESDFEAWKVQIDADIESVTKQRWMDVATRTHEYLRYLDDNKLWRAESDSWFSSVTETHLDDTNISDSVPFIYYQDRVVANRYFMSSMARMGVCYGEETTNSAGSYFADRTPEYEPSLYHIDYYMPLCHLTIVKIFEYTVNEALHKIRLLRAFTAYPPPGVEFYSDEFGNTFTTLENAIEWHKNLEHERLLNTVYSPVREIVQEWYTSLNIDSNRPEQAWIYGNTDSKLDNLESEIWRNYVVESVEPAPLNTRLSKAGLMPGRLQAFYMNLGRYTDHNDSVSPKDMVINVKLLSSDPDIGIAEVECLNLLYMGESFIPFGLETEYDRQLEFTNRTTSELCFIVKHLAHSIDEIDYELKIDLVDELTDANQDGIPDTWAINNGLANQSAMDDFDSDGLTNLEEYQNSTDPRESDTDRDGMSDGWEVLYGLNPNEANGSDDIDLDGLSNLEEYMLGLSPIKKQTNIDGPSDAQVRENMRAAWMVPVISSIIY